MRLAGIRVGKVRRYATRRRDGREGFWESGIGKTPVEGAVRVGRLGIEGDEQADLVNHGGVDKAVLCYPRRHYEAWVEELGHDAPGEGTLGENLEMVGATERDVCVGDVYRAGTVTVQVSQPRQPCWKPATLHGLPDLTARILKSGRTGWYLRVLEEGEWQTGDGFARLDRPHEAWSTERASRVAHFSADDEERRELAALEALARSWRDWLGG